MFDPLGGHAGTGYSGAGLDKNDPTSEIIKDKGPIPKGMYTMLTPVNSHVHGPFAIPLEPDTSNEMFGRDHFLCHGDSIVDPGSASEGCIIQGHEVRVAMWESNDHRLLVVGHVE
jgi:hypothetical protein